MKGCEQSSDTVRGLIGGKSIMLLTGLSFRGVMSSRSHVSPQCAVFSGVHQRAAAEASRLTEAGGPAQRRHRPAPAPHQPTGRRYTETASVTRLTLTSNTPPTVRSGRQPRFNSTLQPTCLSRACRHRECGTCCCASLVSAFHTADAAFSC